MENYFEVPSKRLRGCGVLDLFSPRRCGLVPPLLSPYLHNNLTTALGIRESTAERRRLLVADLSIRSITGPKASLAIITPRAPPIIGARKAASCMMIHWQTSHRGTPALVNEAIFSCVPCKSAAAPDWVRGNGSRRNNPASCHATAGPLQLQRPCAANCSLVFYPRSA